MGARQRAEHMDQDDERRAGGDRIAEQSDRDVPGRQPLAHDPGADHHRQQQRRAQQFGRKTTH
jgi:hypothetical protein